MVFSTWFYIVVLIFQSRYAESNSLYNRQIQVINKLVYQKKYPEAYLATEILGVKSIFTNNDLMRLERNLRLQIHSKKIDTLFKPRTVGDVVVKSLALYHNKRYDSALDLIKVNTVGGNVNNDSLIKFYEIIASNKPQRLTTKRSFNKMINMKQLRINEALYLLDLMKRKEKIFF